MKQVGPKDVHVNPDLAPLVLLDRQGAMLEGGIIYLVSGGGGAKPYPIARTAADLYKDPSFPNYHYLLFHFDGKQITAVMYRLSDPKADKLIWETKDTFTIPMKP